MDGKTWQRLIAICGAASLGLVAACSDDPETDTGVTPDGGTADSGFRPDAAGDSGVDSGVDGGNTDAEVTDRGFIKVNFTIDDTANRIYDQAGGLAWKGSFVFNNTSRVMVKNGGWTGPFATLWDDGPVSTGGHEPEGSTAGDNKWGIEALVAKPEADEMYEYGAISGSVDGSDGNWIWSLQHGANGTFTVPAAGDAPITTTGLTLPAFGTVDFRLTINTSSLAPEFSTFDPANGITVKSSGWGWSEQPCLDNGMAGDVTSADGVFTFVLSENVGPGKPLRYSGLLKSGDNAEFVFVLGGTEYKVATVPPTAGVKAYVKPMGAPDWTEVPVTNLPAPNNNTVITVP